MLELTSNTLVTLAAAKRDCFEKLFEAVNITCQISEFTWQ